MKMRSCSPRFEGNSAVDVEPKGATNILMAAHKYRVGQRGDDRRLKKAGVRVCMDSSRLRLVNITM
jgi:hypothetical protein